MVAFLPNNELVCKAWLHAIPGLAGVEVVTTFPTDEVAFPLLQDRGIIQATVVSGTPDMYVPQNQPIFQLDCWAAKPNSEKPHWGKANQLAEVIKAACVGRRGSWGRVALPAAFEDARVQVANVTREPRRIVRDDARFGGYTLDVQLFWVRVGGG